MSNTLNARTILLMTIPPLLWAGNAIVGRLLVGQVPPLTLNALRWLLAALILMPMGWRALASWQVLQSRWVYLLTTGTLGIGLYNALQYTALITSTPLNVTLIASSMPVWMLVVGMVRYGERPRWQQVLGTVLSLLGVLVVISRGQWATLTHLHLAMGDLYIVIAIIAWALYSWQLVKAPPSMQPPQRPNWNWAEFLLVQIAFGWLGAGGAALFEWQFTDAHIHWSLTTALALLYVALGPAVLAYRCWGLGVQRGGPALAAFFSNLTPLFAAAMSSLWLHEAPQWFHAAAFALIVGGIIVSSLKSTGTATTGPLRAS